MPKPILVLTGPTAVGKTALSLALVDHLEAELISADSRQVYCELNIGTAKPSAEELAYIRHHFINERHLTEDFSAGRFQEEGRARISGHSGSR